MARRLPPSLSALLKEHAPASQPVAVVLAGHNGSGKSSLWYGRLADEMQIPLVNADRLTLSLLPPEDPKTKHLRPWATRLRDEDERWLKLAQDSVQLFMGLVMDQGMPFAFETVFSHWKRNPDGSISSKADLIHTLHARGYYVILLFVGLANVNLSIVRVSTRRQQGGHDVPMDKLVRRFSRTQQAIAMASKLADLTLMFDNSRDPARAFTLARAQRGTAVLYDCRDAAFTQDESLLQVAGEWLTKVAPL